MATNLEEQRKRHAAGIADTAGLRAMGGVPWPKCQHAYHRAFDAAMRDHGYRYNVNAACDCADDGEEGHAPQCGYELALPQEVR